MFLPAALTLKDVYKRQISQGQQNARRDSTFSVKNEGLSNISSAKATQTEPSPER